MRLAPKLPRRQYPSFLGIAALMLLVAFQASLSAWSPVGTIVLWIAVTGVFIAWGIYSDLRLFRASRYYHRELYSESAG